MTDESQQAEKEAEERLMASADEVATPRDEIESPISEASTEAARSDDSVRADEAIAEAGAALDEAVAGDEAVGVPVEEEPLPEEVLDPEAAAALAHIAAGYENEDLDDVQPLELNLEGDDRPVASGDRNWYILKVQSNREESIKAALMRRINVAGLNDFFGDIIVPVEMVTEFKNGKKRVVKRKLYPGYIVAHMELTEETWYLVRDTHGIGDFTNAGGRPSPMPESEVSRILQKQEEKTEEQPKLKISFQVGDRVKIREGTFENFEGDVDSIDEANGRVTVMINIFGRSTPVELEYWQVESL